MKLGSLILRLGVLSAFGLGSVLWLAVQIGQLTGPAGVLADTYQLTAKFSDATGVIPGDEVRMSGVRIGKVKKVAVEKGKAIVGLDIDDRYQVPADSRIELHWRNLLGQRYVSVVPPKGARADGPTEEAGAVIGPDRTAAAADLSTLLNNTEPLLADLDTETMNRAMATLAAAFEGREQTMARALDNSAVLVDTLSTRADAIGSTIGNLATLLSTVAERDDDVRSLLTSLGITAETLAARSGDLDAAITGTSDLAGVLDRVLEASGKDLDRFLDQADAIATTLAKNKKALGEGIRTLPWTSAAVLRASNHGDWLQIYGRGFGVINTFQPEPRVGPDYSDVGPDDTRGPDPVLGSPSAPTPPIPETEAGPVTVNPERGSEPDEPTDLERLLDPVTEP